MEHNFLFDKAKKTSTNSGYLFIGSIGDTEDGLPGEEGEQELVHRGVRGGLGQDEGGGGVRSPLHPSQVLWGADVLRAMKRGP